jgi:hypothetical protein
LKVERGGVIAEAEIANDDPAAHDRLRPNAALAAASSAPFFRICLRVVRILATSKVYIVYSHTNLVIVIFSASTTMKRTTQLGTVHPLNWTFQCC